MTDLKLFCYKGTSLIFTLLIPTKNIITFHKLQVVIVFFLRSIAFYEWSKDFKVKAHLQLQNKSHETKRKTICFLGLIEQKNILLV